MTKRNQAFDFLCGVCIIRMVCLHTCTYTGLRGEEWWKEIMAWSFFFMCFFFFKAGYFNKTVSGNTKEYIKDKAKRLLVPYVSWGAIGFLVFCAFLPFEINRYHHPIEPMEWSHLWKTSSVYGNDPVWFLMSFFCAYVLVHLIKKIHIVKPISVFQTVIILACPFVSYWLYTLDNPLPLSLSNVFMGVFFFNLGRTWHWVLDRLEKNKALVISLVLIVAFIVSNILWHGEYVMASNRFTGNPLAAFLNTMIILLGLSGFLIKLPIGRVPVISYIGQHSMVYFVLHYPIIEAYRFTHICFGHSIYNHVDDFLMLPVIIFCICTWLVPYIEAVPYLSGRFKKSEAKPVASEAAVVTNEANTQQQ